MTTLSVRLTVVLRLLLSFSLLCSYSGMAAQAQWVRMLAPSYPTQLTHSTHSTHSTHTNNNPTHASMAPTLQAMPCHGQLNTLPKPHPTHTDTLLNQPQSTDTLPNTSTDTHTGTHTQHCHSKACCTWVVSLPILTLAPMAALATITLYSAPPTQSTRHGFYSLPKPPPWLS